MSDGTINQPGRATPPSPPAVGRFKRWVSSVTGKPMITDGGGNSYGYESVYGSDYIGGSAVGEDTNTTSTFATYLGFAYPAGTYTAGSKYEIEFVALIRYSVGTRNQNLRVALDSVTLEEEISFEHKDSGGDVRVPVGYKYIVDGAQLNGAGGFIDFDHRAQLNGDTSYVYSCTLTFKRVS